MENCTECPEFRCKNGLCILYEKVCDGMVHMEFIFEKKNLLEILLQSHIHNIFVVTGVNQCGDFFDEEHCSFECKKGEYFCHPKGCLTPDKLCDRVVDCYNAFDEAGCINTTTTSKPDDTEKVQQSEKNVSKTHHCGPHEFQCTNWKECVPLEVRCDSYQDCFDRY